MTGYFKGHSSEENIHYCPNCKQVISSHPKPGTGYCSNCLMTFAVILEPQSAVKFEHTFPLDGDNMYVIFRSAYMPEQYTVHDETGTQIAYICIKRGHMTVECPDACDTLVYESDVEGYDALTELERDRHLRRAKKAIEAYYNKE